jgi:hypothetical protein
MFVGSKVRPVCKDGKFTALCEPIIPKMWDPQHLTTI